MKQVKTISLLVLIGLVAILALQNVASVEVQFLAWSMTMPRAILVLVVLIVGFVAGLIVASIVVRQQTE